MDSPERDLIGTPISKIEESPFSNFVNSLSPIKPTKVVNISQTFSSLSFSSPPSVFTSPHVSLQKESKFLRRCQLLELTKLEFTPTDEKRACGNEGATDTAQKLESSSTEGLQCLGVFSGAGIHVPICGVSGYTIELRRAVRHDCASPNRGSGMPSCSNTRSEGHTSSAIPFGEGSLGGCLFADEFNCQDAKEHNEGTSHEWDSLVSDAAHILVSDSPNDTTCLEGKSWKPFDGDISFFASLFEHDNVKSQQKTHRFVSMSSSDQNESRDHCTESADPGGEKQIQKEKRSMVINSINKCLTSPCQKSENEPNYNCHRSTRRRCLVFEIPGGRKNIDVGSVSSSSSSLHEGENGNMKKPVTSLISGSNTSQCFIPGIGLHLNALAVASKEHRILDQEATGSEGRGTIPEKTLFDCVINSSDSTFFEKEMGVEENEDQVVEEAYLASASVAGEDLTHSSPRKKRHKSESTGEVEACKRCNCKKSKCLKLYCECFAAGVYCVEPCSCQDCFNKPIYEDTVLATRKQIESRNPLAFAPKVIRSSDAIPDFGDDSTRTPASAWHKQGCNCKKSSCLKKYCECYQGGVGCSIGCRCDGCQNIFGRKDGSMMLGIEAETEEETPGCEKVPVGKSLMQPGFLGDQHNSESAIPRTPLCHLRPSAVHPTSSKGKPPRSAFVMGRSSSGLNPCSRSGRTTFLCSENKSEKDNEAISGDNLPEVLQANGSPSNGVKTLSPNSKRVSPPHHNIRESLTGPKSTRKLILQSVPAFPSLNG